MRIGKIARVPAHVRTELNRRLRDREKGESLLAWLNGVPEVKEILAAHFKGAPINHQNLSEWRRGGFQDWLQKMEASDWVAEMGIAADELQATLEGRPMSEMLAMLMTVEFAQVAQVKMTEGGDTEERWERLKGLLEQLGRLRRDDHREKRMRLDQERWGTGEAGSGGAEALVMRLMGMK